MVIPDLISDQVIYPLINFMEKKKFSKFTRMGEQLDELVENLSEIVNRRTVSSSAKQSTDFESQLIEFFKKNQSLTLESEMIEEASLNSILSWINSKKTISGAKRAHIFRVNIDQGIMLCIFFSNGELNALLEDCYPKKRILCKQIDSDLEAMLNGQMFRTITL